MSTAVASGLGSILTTEIANIVSSMLSDSQSGIYSMYEVSRNERGYNPTGKEVLTLNYKYADIILHVTPSKFVRSTVAGYKNFVTSEQMLVICSNLQQLLRLFFCPS